MPEFDSFQCITKEAFDPATLTGSYQVMNGTGFSDDIKIFKLFNGSTTVSIDISYDGVNNHDFIPPQGTLIIDFQTNHRDQGSNGSGTLYGRKGQKIWGKTASSSAFLQMIGFR
jgi:hypothetical protein